MKVGEEGFCIPSTFEGNNYSLGESQMGRFFLQQIIRILRILRESVIYLDKEKTKIKDIS
jgi:hypothetical protein